ncbi:MAG: tRNA (adenosine(37)-N6)-dimethylallyltransferase MiaA, partial [Litorilinea sp.]
MTDDLGRQRPLVVILGATGVGKTALSLALCEQFHGEVVSADSRQIYVGMDIGTAKASAAEQARVPHHLLDVRTPAATLTLAEYQAMAYAEIDAIHARAGVPFLVGGTALYIRAVAEGLRIPEVPPNLPLRAELEAQLAQEGRAALFVRLQRVDPAAAAVVDPQNHRRVMRALEIFLTTGRSKVELEGSEPPPYAVLKIGLRRGRADLHARIDARVGQMVEQGLVAEVQSLLAAGYDPALPALTSLGYREIGAYLQGELTLPAAIERIQIETHRYVRHQETWFRRMQGVQWYDL